MHPYQSESTKKSRWSAEEDECVINLRGSGMKWDDISKRMGRSRDSCRMHYQNYLERRSERNEDRKTLLAILYEKYVIDPAYLNTDRAVTS